MGLTGLTGWTPKSWDGQEEMVTAISYWSNWSSLHEVPMAETSCLNQIGLIKSEKWQISLVKDQPPWRVWGFKICVPMCLTWHRGRWKSWRVINTPCYPLPVQWVLTNSVIMCYGLHNQHCHDHKFLHAQCTCAIHNYVLGDLIHFFFMYIYIYSP